MSTYLVDESTINTIVSFFDSNFMTGDNRVFTINNYNFKQTKDIKKLNILFLRINFDKLRVKFCTF